MKKLTTLIAAAMLLALSSCGKQEITQFGKYEQDGNADNGQEAIEWLVLEETEKAKLLISVKGLDVQKFHNTKEDTNWAQSNIRNWLNDTFLQEAFSKDEQAKIFIKEVDTAQNRDYFTTSGDKSNDRVFLLSIEEAEEYFEDRFARQLEPTAAALKKGAQVNEDGYGIWWLRSTGRTKDHAAIVGYFGNIDTLGQAVNYGDTELKTQLVVRPAIWIKK